MKTKKTSHNVIQLEKISKVYNPDGGSDARVDALREIDLSIEEGDFTAIMGASGSGKSTLMNIVGCLDRPTTGIYKLDGTIVNDLDRDSLSAIRNQKIGFVFQGFNLLSRTSALENVELPLVYDRGTTKRKDRLEKARHALDRVGLANRMNHHPNQLSGGQQQRVAIARALVTNPSLILADEPTGNLDSKTSIEILHLFQKLNDSGITIVLVTHEHDIAGYTRRVVEFKDGSIIKNHKTTQIRIKG
jgi:putative ABC transport system ATP-binding protein